MQFGSLTVEQWHHQLAATPTATLPPPESNLSAGSVNLSNTPASASSHRSHDCFPGPDERHPPHHSGPQPEFRSPSSTSLTLPLSRPEQESDVQGTSPLIPLSATESPHVNLTTLTSVTTPSQASSEKSLTLIAQTSGRSSNSSSNSISPGNQPTTTPYVPTSQSIISTPPAAPTPLTWAARVASGRSSLITPAHSLPSPHSLPRSLSTAVPSLERPSSVSKGDNRLSPTSLSPESPNTSTSLAVHSTSHPPFANSPPRRRRRSISSASLPPRRLKGLINGGNGCFINVVLQAMLASDAFRELLDEYENPPERSLLGKFCRLVNEMVSDSLSSRAPQPVKTPNPISKFTNILSLKDGALVKEDAVLPDWFYDVFPSSRGVGSVVSKGGDKSIVSASGGSQEDAEEFLSYVLNALHEELVAWGGVSGGKPAANGDLVTNGSSYHTVDGRVHAFHTGSETGTAEDDDVWTEMTRNGKSVEIRGGEFAQSGVTDIFGGQLRSEVRRGRSKTSVTREPFFILSLDIENGLIRDVEHALCAYFEPEFVEGYTTDDGNGVAINARKQVSVMQLPKVLILHLKRFSHNSVTGALNKVSRNMMFPELLQIPGKVMHNAGNRWNAEGGKSYELIAVITHLGKELAGGHYTCDVRWQNENKERGWFTCDDMKVVRTTWQKVSRKQAYLLFYSAV